MPYLNEHAGRLRDPSKFKEGTIRRKKRQASNGKTYIVLYGKLKGKTAMTEQAYRYPVSDWSAAQARAHAKKHNMIAFEAASESMAASADPLDFDADVHIASVLCGDVAAVTGRRTEAGVPVQRFRKRLFFNDVFVKEGAGVQYTVTPKTIHHWVDTFAAMKANGTVVRIPDKHSDTPMPSDPMKTHGVVVDMFAEPCEVAEEERLALAMTCDIKGEDSIEAALKNDVSVYSPREWIDSRGNRYVRPITHVALVPDPLVQGLGSFIPIAASQKEKPMNWDEIKEALGIEEEMTDENAVELIASLAMARTEAQKALQKELDDLKASVAEASKSGEGKSGKEDDPLKIEKVKPDAELVRLSVKDRRSELAQLVAGGHINKAAHDELLATHATEEAVIASLESKDGRAGFDSLIASLEKNVAFEPGEKTERQTLQSTLKGSDGQDNALVADAKARAAAVKK